MVSSFVCFLFFLILCPYPDQLENTPTPCPGSLQGNVMDLTGVSNGNSNIDSNSIGINGGNAGEGGSTGTGIGAAEGSELSEAFKQARGLSNRETQEKREKEREI